MEGEEAAIRFLTAHGWSIEAHRFRMGRHELDLVARRGALVAFVEVKTRRGGGYGAGREAIGWRKRRALGRVAEAWRLRHGRPEDVYRFDVVEVLYGSPRDPGVVHVEDAWRL
jgi:putative endonuclease